MEPFQRRLTRIAVCAGIRKVRLRLSGNSLLAADNGNCGAADVSAKMANAIDRSSTLQKIYNPAELAAVRRADQARIRGRQLRRSENG